MSKFTCCCLPQSYLTVWSAWHSNLWICLLQTMCLRQHGLGCLFSVRSTTSHNDSSEKKPVWKKCEGCIVGNARLDGEISTADKLQRTYFVCIILICKLLCIKVSKVKNMSDETLFSLSVDWIGRIGLYLTWLDERS